ncbi:prohibitin family protein [Subsaximicrobium wynnwilliamsii]|uniref:Prohibitin family protein n=1 Tax=Subsaximicrobium wynnwilliamsii TaxID=291179 RepID=A0A5C6ZHY1_9FLAO|nr:prohibitin family protein [Subsaximicrobium wynnwilliamsii]TXD83153.1 prohibitin family protein [Subsaximicrobium wynnwilliamsii]TXD88266.1 prohibitin family protein [Subsaximicrobium wynnwilliamsii]TXE02987.1 prohibitin family protein [Subsaximicrobium wynnwilliamsii]
MKNNFFLLTGVLILFSNCAVIRPGEAGVKQTLGKFSDKVITQGTVVYNPFISKVLKESTQTNNINLVMSLPSKEGLSVDAEISILYRLEQNKIPSVLRNLGQDYEDIITSVFRSASSDVCAKFFAKDMHSGMRADIEREIKLKMDENLEKQADGIELISVLMKRIRLPLGLSNSIEQRLQAEQDAMRMEFVIQQAKLEAERKIIDAEGERDAQIILATGLTPDIIKIKSIDAFNKLSISPNSKIIITDGKTPMLINANE